MNLAQGAVSFLVRNFKGAREYFQGAISHFMVQRSASWQPMDTAGLVERFSHWVAVCSRMNGFAVASVPLRLYAARGTGQGKARHGVPVPPERLAYVKSLPSVLRRSVVKAATEVEEITVHPFLDLMQSMNPLANATDTIAGTVIFLDMAGNAYWHIARDAFNTPYSVFLMPSQWTRVVPSRVSGIEGFRFGRVETEAVMFPPEDVVHFRFPNPRDILYGAGCLESMAKAADRYESYNDYEKALSDNRARPDFVVNYKAGKLQPERRKELETEWNRKFRGAANAGKVWVADYDFDFKELGFSPADVAKLETRKWTRLEIADAFGIPLSFLDTENVNRANALAAREQYATNTIAPRLRIIEEKLNESLVPSYDQRLFVAFDDPTPADKEMQLKAREIAVKGGAYTWNELRALEGLPPMPNGDMPLVSGLLPLDVAIEQSRTRQQVPGAMDPNKPEPKPSGKRFAWFPLGCSED